MQIVEWLSLPKEERPHLIMAYFNQPDTIGHFRQLEQELDAQLIELDHLLNDLFTSLYSKDLLSCINILIVSDHGMQKLERRYYLNEYINTTGMIISSGVIARIRLADSGITLDELKQHFRCSNNGTQYRIYDNMHIPKRYHYAHSDRIGDLILEGMPGVILFGDKGSDVGVVADHGYDYLADSMHAIFYARGPDIKPKSLIEPFQNVELFNLIIDINSDIFSTDLLGLPNIFPNNGTYGRLHEVLINPPKKITHRQSMQLYKCSANGQSRPPRMTSCDIGCEKVAEEVTSSLSACPSVPSLNVTGFYPDVISYCHVSLCPVTVLLSMSRLDAHSLTIYEPLSVIDMQPQRSEVQMCTFLYDQFSVDCEQWNTKRYIATASRLRYHSLFTNTHSKYNNIDRVQTLLFDSFINGPFAHLQNLTQMCIRKYGRLMVITGNIFDYDNNGIADSNDVFRREVDGELLRERPSHIFRILLRCNDSRWSADNQTCRDVSETRALAFILPNVPDDLNCLEPMEYLFVNTARIRDIELLTGLEFFIDRNRYDENVAVRMRTYIQQNLWEC
uniref:NUC domain-containing protein n=1 Tax=Ascaris lumbricoides TaxID=6252 RepID=A0A0M3ILW9_ASCLU